MAKRGYVHSMASKMHATRYRGVTSNLAMRVHRHKEGTASSFTKRYNAKRLVYLEEHELITDTIQRDSNIKHRPRSWKIRFIESVDPERKGLTE
jgi:putative endonuclease